MQRRTFCFISQSSKKQSKALYANFHTSAFLQEEAAKKKPIVTIFGSGYVGRNVAKKLAPIAETVIVASRSGEDFKKYQKDVPANVRFEKCDVKDQVNVESLISASQVVVNTVGIQYEAEHTFVESFIDGSKHIAHGTQKFGPRFIKISALGSDVDHDSRILDMDYRGADISYGANPNGTILKSALMFGDNGSRLLQGLASFAKLPVCPLPRASGAFQPVFVEDVAQAVLKCVQDDSTKGKTYELAGPTTYNFKDFIKALTRNLKGSEQGSFVPVPSAFIDALLLISQFLPDPTFTRDHLPLKDAHLCVRSEIAEGEEAPLTFSDLGIKPKSMDEVYRGLKQ